MAVSLYTVRVVLSTLGEIDYGIYQTVGGVVSLFLFLSTSMAQASQRFLSFALGENNFDKLQKTFSNTQIIYLLIALILVILLETIGTYYVYNHLIIPPDRVEAARWVFHFFVLSFFISFNVTPYTSMIFAHEDMYVYAYLSISESILKLVVIFFLTFFSFDKLQLYSVLMFGVSVFIAIFYVMFCQIRYKECKLILVWDKKIIKEMLEFVGWSTFGSFAIAISTQAITILLNQMFTPVVVAARAVAMQIGMAVSSFSTSFSASLTPPIVKSYARKETNQFYTLVLKGTKVTYYLMLIIVLPVFHTLPLILALWLQNPPPNTLIFVRLILIKVLIDSVSFPLMDAARATGKIRLYELSLGSILILDFIVAWLVVGLGAEVYFVFIVEIGAALIMFFVRFVIVRYLTGLSFRNFLRETLIPTFLVTFLAIIVSYFFVNYFFPGLILTILAIVAITGVLIYFIGINNVERVMVNNALKKGIRKYYILYVNKNEEK
jgi:O-antigen/teichoic acid export membrane protein